MIHYVEIARLSEWRTDDRPAATDNAYAVRVIAWACWRFYTGSGPKDAPMRYLETAGDLDLEPYFPPPAEYWAWYRGEQGYSSINECLARALDEFEYELYVGDVDSRPRGREQWTTWRAEYGANKGRLAAALVRTLAEDGVLECPRTVHRGWRAERRSLGPTEYDLNLLALDSWVVSKLIQFNDHPGF